MRLVVPVAAVVAGSGLSLVPSPRADAGNVVVNSTLDESLAGWKVNPGATLTRVPGRDGAAARISHSRGRAWTIALNDVVNSVAATRANAVYRAQAWVRATRAGQRISLRVMEYRGSVYLGQRLASVTVPDTAWHPLSLTYSARSTGAGLDLNIVAHRLPRGVSVDADEIRLIAPPTPGGGPAGPGSAASVSAARPTEPSPASAASTSSSGSAPHTSTSAASTSSSGSAPHTSTSAASTSAASTSAASTRTAASTTSAAASTPAGWRLVWGDEFNAAAVDASRWRVEHLSTYGDGNNELACLMNRPENVQVSGGVLHLVARREASTVRCGTSDARFPGGRAYTSGHLSTKGLAEWTYGRFEVRAKLPTAPGTTKGLWPAFWLRPTAGGTGELDVLEAIGSDGSGDEHTKVHQTIWYDYSGTYRHEPATVTVPNGLPSASYHVYAAEWEPGAIRWYIDGRLTYTRTRTTTPWLDSAFNKPFYLRLNLAVGGGWPGSPTSGTTFPASYDIDYVRVYQR